MMIYKVFVFCLLLFISVFHYNDAFCRESLKVISFNIRNECKGDGINNWNNRKDALSAFLLNQKADIICLQEVLSSQLIYLQNVLYNFQSIGVGCADGKKGGMHNIIFLDTTKFELIETGYYWLSESPEQIGSVSWDAKAPRIVTWARVKYKRNGKRVLIVNTHLDYAGKEAREKSVSILLNWKGYDLKKETAVICGDFNSYPNSIPYQTMIRNLYNISDTFEIAKERIGVDYSFHKFGQINLTSRKRVDYIFVTPKIKVSKINIPKEDKSAGFYLSDHNPVICLLKI